MNTGKKITLTLKLRNITTGILTGTTKSNTPGSPDYIPPVQDITACPVNTAFTCPIVRLADIGGGSLNYEFSLPVTSLLNSSLKKVQVILKDSSNTILATQEYTVFSPNYFNANFTGLTTGILYKVDLIYKNISNTTVNTCTDTATITLAGGPPGIPPALTQISNTDNSPVAGKRTQQFQVEPSVSAGNKFTLQVYSHMIVVIATGGDNPASIAGKLRDAVNTTTPIQWNEFGSAPPTGTMGYPPSATASGDVVTVILNRVNQFAGYADIS